MHIPGVRRFLDLRPDSPTVLQNPRILGKSGNWQIGKFSNFHVNPGTNSEATTPWSGYITHLRQANVSKRFATRWCHLTFFHLTGLRNDSNCWPNLRLIGPAPSSVQNLLVRHLLRDAYCPRGWTYLQEQRDIIWEVWQMRSTHRFSYDLAHSRCTFKVWLAKRGPCGCVGPMPRGAPTLSPTVQPQW